MFIHCVVVFSFSLSCNHICTEYSSYHQKLSKCPSTFCMRPFYQWSNSMMTFMRRAIASIWISIWQRRDCFVHLRIGCHRLSKVQPSAKVSSNFMHTSGAHSHTNILLVRIKFFVLCFFFVVAIFYFSIPHPRSGDRISIFGQHIRMVFSCSP